MKWPPRLTRRLAARVNQMGAIRQGPWSVEFFLLMIIGFLLATIALAKAPFSQPYPAHLELAQKILNGESLKDTGYTLGYPVFLAFWLKCAGLKGVFAGQALLYLGIIFLAYFILRHLLETGRKISFLVSLVICFHPYLLLNIKRIIYTELTVFLILVFVSVLIWIRKHGLRPLSAILSGFVSGLIFLDRSTMISVFPLVFAALFFRKKICLRRIFLSLMLIFSTLLTIAVATIPLKGKFCLVDSLYGSYNFYAGVNPHTFKFLIQDYDAEYSIEPGLADHGIAYTPFKNSNPELPNLYLTLGKEYIRRQPLRYIALTFLKALTLFRPDYRRIYESDFASPSFIFVVQTFLTLPAPLWMITRLRLRHIGLMEGPMAIPLLTLWIIPFIFSNVDPRLRLPIDIVLIIDTAFCWGRTKEFPWASNKLGIQQ